MTAVTIRASGHLPIGSDDAGAVSVLFATAIVPMVMLVGLVFDFSWTTQAKAQLDLAADSAAIAAARTAANAYAAGLGTSAAQTLGQTAGSEWFKAQTGNILDIQATPITPTFSVMQNGVRFTSSVSYTAVVNDVLPNFFNWTANRNGATYGNIIANTVGATVAVNKYETIDFLLDNTSSMMIAATDADAAKMVAAAAAFTPQSNVPAGLAGVPCTFACHWDASSNDYYGLSRKLGITLRYDVVQSATQTAIAQMQALEAVPGQLSLGVFTFGDPTAPFRTVFPEALVDDAGGGAKGGYDANSGATKALAAVKTIVTPVTPDVPNTNFAKAMNALAAAVSTSGTGSTAADPQKSVILITDGIEDDTNPQSIPSTEGPINPTVCNVMKQKGYTVYVLYTTYSSASVNLPFSNINLVPYITGSASNDLVPSLQSCSSGTGDMITASSPSDIQAGIGTLLQQAVGSSTRLTN